MKIAVIGTGYVGLVTATCLAESGNDVVGIDKDAAKIDTLHGGKLPIYEPGLLELVQRNAREGRLTFTTDLADAVLPARLIFIAVGTPQSDARRRRPVRASGPSRDAIAAALKAQPAAAAGQESSSSRAPCRSARTRSVAERLAAAGCPAASMSPATPSS